MNNSPELDYLPNGAEVPPMLEPLVCDAIRSLERASLKMLAMLELANFDRNTIEHAMHTICTEMLETH